eukprot:756604-Hanusia_phi.AAC.6
MYQFKPKSFLNHIGSTVTPLIATLDTGVDIDTHTFGRPRLGNESSDQRPAPTVRSKVSRIRSETHLALYRHAAGQPE